MKSIVEGDVLKGTRPGHTTVFNGIFFTHKNEEGSSSFVI